MRKILSYLHIKHFAIGFVLLCSLLVLLMSLKGTVVDGKIADQADYEISVGSPLELSNSTSRYELVRSIVDRGTVFFNAEQVKDAAPDVVEYENRFFSIFTPGVSFVAIPFYLAGKTFGVGQIGAFLVNTLFAVMNLIFVALLARRIGANKWASMLSGFTFVFATNAFGYSLSLTQHHLSTLIILSSLYIASSKKSALSNIAIGLLFAAGILVDIPNAFMLFPIFIYSIARHFSIKNLDEKFTITLKPIVGILLLAVIPLVGLFAWYNLLTAGSYTKLAQNIGRPIQAVQEAALQNKVVDLQSEVETYSPIVEIPFQTRNMLNGLYVLLVSDERSWLVYSPVLLLGVLGMILVMKKSKYSTLGALLIAVVAVDVTLYSTFGDPWGGWSYGPRYLIPAAACMAALLSLVITKFRKKPLFIAIFLILFAYSALVSTLGALTTNAVPPKGEAQNLKPQLKHTYEYNMDFAKNTGTSSLFYNALLQKWIAFPVFYASIAGLIVLLAGFQYIFLIKEKYDN